MSENREPRHDEVPETEQVPEPFRGLVDDGSGSAQDREQELPPIQTWWPHLTTAARHDVLDDPRAQLSPRVVREIALITGRTPAQGAQLDDEERQFVRHQTEAVD